jgi:hypothetical protein
MGNMSSSWSCKLPRFFWICVFFSRKDGSNKKNMELWNWTLSFSVSWTAGHPVELWNGSEVPRGKLLGWGGKHHGWLCLHCLLAGHSKPLVLPCLDSNFELVISKNWLNGQKETIIFMLKHLGFPAFFP